MNHQKIIIFDFCKTLISFETADEFVKFCLQNTAISKLFYFYILDIWIRSVNKVSFIIAKKNYICNGKYLRLRCLRNIPKFKIEQLAQQFFIKKIQPNLITETMLELKKHIERKEIVFIVSAGYETYLKFFSQKYNVQLICSKVKFNNELCTGQLSAPDCIGKQKLIDLNRVLNLSESNLEQSICYSDSYMDKPLFNMVDYPIAVLNKKYKKNTPDWAMQPPFQILWWK